jgi:AcrR family transcriptional regulator
MPEPSRKGARRRAQIIDGALAAIRASAVADVQLAVIAEHAGLKPSHVLYYFASRDEVLVAAAQHVEQTLAEGRGERLAAIEDPGERLRAFVVAYLPDDRSDPIWKLWVEGWLRSTSWAAFAEVGDAAHAGWLDDLTAAVLHHGGALDEDPRAFARRMLFVLDGLAIHVVGGHLSPGEALELALTTLRSELRA